MRGENDGEGSDVYFTKTERVACVDFIAMGSGTFLSLPVSLIQ